MPRPKLNNSFAQRELDRAEEQFQKFDDHVKSLTVDEMNKAPVVEKEPQTKLSDREANKMDASYIKPNRAIFSKEPFNENFRKEYEEGMKYVKCIVENNEVKGENVTCWLKLFPGTPAQEWIVPVNKPIHLPKFVAEHLASRSYHRMIMEDRPTGEAGGMQFYGALAVKETHHRIDARPVGFGFISMAG